MTLQNHFNRIVEQTTLTTKYANIFNKDIKDFNKKLKAVEMIQENHTLWINFFIDLVKLVPDNINLKNITINGNKILITGSAKTRDELLNFKENLENSEVMSQVIIPLDNLLKKEDVNFDLKADINLDELKTL